MSNLEPSHQTSSSIKLTQRDDRSSLSSISQKAIKTFSKTILKTHPPVPSGSPQLTPHHSTKKHCQITEHQIADTYIYTYTSLSPPSSPSSRIVLDKLYYFAGGGFRSGALKEHWALCAELCRKLPEYQINLVSYPLAPNSPAAHSLPHLRRFYDMVAAQAKDDGCRITLMGDSAGGNIALVLGIYGANLWLENGYGIDEVCPLRNIMVMSPPTDLRNTHPGIDEIDAHDPILSRTVITEVAERWRHELAEDDPTVSPLLADLSVFKKANVQVDGVVGLYDCLAPDSVEFRKKLESEGVRGEWLEWDKQMHCFPLTFSYRIPEGVFGKDWIIDVLRRNVENSLE
ncbi:c65ff521-0ca1-442d-b209-243a8ded2068-CDS [Sclerotinia trifoliorum]|uniref:C65ff521-0ca1-442d-b209-243a8ded2068-CDS n=1 Tax=Sclerotinia trifoliorum TaxID=28548 RepID=A0A8H2VWR9_9HELO|nr:c65ff521-0ca1-442d-b209-243a8ded2068-CDS [Sclerotinia trifoliorum]